MGIPIFTPARLACFKRMQAAGSKVWVDLVKPQMDDATGTVVYGEEGLGALIAWECGDGDQYATQAAKIVSASIHDGMDDRNWIRGYFGQSVLTAWSVKDAIDPALLATIKGQLQHVCNVCMGVGTPDYAGGFRITDTDQTIGQFWGLMLCKALFPDLTIPLVSGGGGNEVHPLGDLDATGVDDNSVRDAIARLVSLAKGGEWLVSSGYNCSDDTFLLQFMWLSLKQITGVDHFPEIRDWMKEWAWMHMHDCTPDRKDFAHVGDDQTANSVGYWDRAVAVACTARCLEEAGETELASYVQFYFNELFAQYGDVWPNRISPQIVLWLDDQAPAKDYRQAIPRTVDCSQGFGQVTRHDGWTDDGQLIWNMTPNNTGVDHQTAFVGALQIYDKGRWVLQDPIGYGEVDDARPLNCPLYGGYSTMNLFGAYPAVDAGDYLLTGGWTSGFPGWTNQYNPPPSFMPEKNERIIFTLPKLKIAVVLDRFNLSDPRKLPDSVLSQYAGSFKSTINSASLKEVRWHCPNGAAVVTPTGAKWLLADSSPVRLDCLATGGALTTAVDDLDKIYTDPRTWNACNKGSTRIRFHSDREGAECVVSVFQWGDVQDTPTVEQFDASKNMLCVSIGKQAIFFKNDGTMPTAPKASSFFTDYLIGTDAAGKWSVQVQQPLPPVTPSPVPATVSIIPSATFVDSAGKKFAVGEVQ